MAGQATDLAPHRLDRLSAFADTHREPPPSMRCCDDRLNSAQYLAIRYTERLRGRRRRELGGIEGRPFDNALAETVNGLYKAELIDRQGPWHSVGQVELETAAWVHWWNTQRLHGACENVPPAEYEAAYWADAAGGHGRLNRRSESPRDPVRFNPPRSAPRARSPMEGNELLLSS